MTTDGILRIIALYRDRLKKAASARCPNDRLPDFEEAARHCKWMLGEMERHAAEWPEDKLNRWLGFVQGALWMLGVYTIDDLRNHVIDNRD